MADKKTNPQTAIPLQANPVSLNHPPTNEGNELFEAIHEPVFVVTPDGIIIEANQAAQYAAKKDRSEIVGNGICKIIHGGSAPHTTCPLEDFLLTCTPHVEETTLPGLSGEYLLTILPVIKPEGKVQKIFLIARELTGHEMRKADSLRNAHMAAIGELAAGVAHEVNNPITGIINFAQLLLDDSEKDTTQAELLAMIVDEGERIATIIRNLLSFARESEDVKEPLDMLQVIEECLSLVKHQFKKDGIALSTDYSTDPCQIAGNFRQLQQVLLNLLSNARFALNKRYPNSSPDKKIEIGCHSVNNDQGGSVIQISIHDTGTGIPQGILSKLFDPFFTTKPSGQGTGLGLSISYGIIQDHDGIIKVDSKINQYTDMIIEIPSSNT